MKTFIKTLGFIAVLAFALIPAPVRAQDDDTGVSFQTFYDQLADQGTWINTNDYGYVFQPRVNESDWQPYTYGHWVSTDAGMMWDSDEPFGWATYHYGRWVNLDGTGWVWVPGYTWAPAWVSWRDNDDYVGWAPLPPDTFVGIDFFDPDISFGFGFHIGGDCDDVYGIGPAWYNFCPVAYFGDPYAWRHFRDRRDNFALINNTRNITNINVNNNTNAGAFSRVRANGPSLATLNSRSLTPIQQARLTRAGTLSANGQVQGNKLSVFAPKVNPSTLKTARPGSVGSTLASTSVNRGTNINKPLTVTQGVQAASATPQQIHAATLAQSNVPARAKVATANTRPSRALGKPLTTLQTTANVAGTAKANTAVGAGAKSGAAGGANISSSTSATGNAGLKPKTSAGANISSSSSATGGASHRGTASASSESASTGAASTHHAQAQAQSRSAESTFSGAPTTRHTLAPSSAESSYTGAPTTRHTLAPSRSPEATYSGAPTTRHSLAPSSGSSYHPQMSAPSYRSSAPVYHSQPSSQPSFQSSAPAQHFGGGAPAASHSSGGGQVSGGGGRALGNGRGDKQQ